jgi:hypothetical protein
MKPLLLEVRDQAAHATAAAIIIAPLLLHPAWWTAALAGMGCGLVREITEPGRVTAPGSLRDIAFWTAGATACFLLIR